MHDDLKAISATYTLAVTFQTTPLERPLREQSDGVGPHLVAGDLRILTTLWTLELRGPPVEGTRRSLDRLLQHYTHLGIQPALQHIHAVLVRP